MPKIKYHFNTKSLSFEKVRVTVKDIFLRLLSVVAVGMVFSVVVIFIAYNFFDSPKEKMLKRENDQYKLQYQILNDRLGRISKVLEDLQDRDDNIYRVIFESEPIPNTVRKAGYGGADRYARLEGYENSKVIVETTKKIDQITSQLYVQSKSFDEVYYMAKNKKEMMVCIPAIQPILKTQGRIISGFGTRFHPILKTWRQHTGIDITAPRGTPVYATGDGVVTKSSYDGGYGNCIVINHGYGYETLYAHLFKIVVRDGQKVKRGEKIGYVGSTGLSVAPHVHYEVIKNGQKINPVNYFYNDLSPEEYEKVLEIASKVNQSLS